MAVLCSTYAVRERLTWLALGQHVLLWKLDALFTNTYAVLDDQGIVDRLSIDDVTLEARSEPERAVTARPRSP